MDDFLELRARVEALEARANHIGDSNKMVPPPVATEGNKKPAIINAVVDGDPPAPHKNWEDWILEVFKTSTIKGVRLRAIAPGDFSFDEEEATPPPVATDKELKDTWYKTTGGAICDCRRAIYDLGVAHGQASSREVEELRAELERERIRLAVCGVVAKADTPESAKKARDMHPDYHSASLDDVISMVDALIAERANQAHSWEVAEPAPVAGGLVDAVSDAIISITGSRFALAPASAAILEQEARAAILEQAEWLRERGWEGVAALIELEAGR